MSFDIREIRTRLADPKRVADLLGLHRGKTDRSKWICPRHGGASLSLTKGHDLTLQVRCFGCDFAGDLFTLISEVHGLSDFRETVKVAADFAGIFPSTEVYRRPAARTLPAPPSTLKYPPLDEVRALLGSCTVPADGELSTGARKRCF
jgi:hypothetical protein